MKTRILTAAFALLWWSWPAHADSLPPTDPLVGAWCRQGNIYKRGACSVDDRLVIHQDGYWGHEYSCDFVEVTKVGDSYETLAECSGEGEYRFLHSTFQLSRKTLRQTITFASKRIPEQEQSCHLVGDTPDGFLNLRTGPGMRYKSKIKLVPSDVVKIDAANGEWSHVSVPRLRANYKSVSGWVYSKYIEKEETGCHVP
jgi:hypothetical protein